ncbi:MAG: hypothetical protein KGP01_04980 [Actinomycetales bacterium]|nr:hypothetical protein [Actinomycetales bacterium]
MSNSTAPNRNDPFAPVVNIIHIAARATSEVSSALSEFGEATVVPSAQEALDLVSARAFHRVTDIVLLDGAPADAPTLATVRELRRRGCRVLLLTPRRDELAVKAAMHYGAHGYIVRQPGAHSAGLSPTASTLDLSERELAVLAAVADGASNTDVGELLGISALTVKSHLARIGHKLGTGDRAAMVARVLRAGLIQ